MKPMEDLEIKTYQQLVEMSEQEIIDLYDDRYERAMALAQDVWMNGLSLQSWQYRSLKRLCAILEIRAGEFFDIFEEMAKNLEEA